MTQTYKYLHFVTLRSLVNWSVAYLIKNNTLSSNFPMVSIGTFLTRNKTAIDVKNNVIYKRVTIKTNGGGVCLRDQKSGKDIGTKKQFVVKEGQFIVSKIDARNGAFGVVPPEANNAIITGNFWTFDVNTKIILPQYLALFTATKEFMLFAEKASNGTTNRHYLQEPLFLSQQIPLPSLEEQNKIVAAYNATIAQADNLSQQAGDINDQIETYLKEILGIGAQLSSISDGPYRFMRIHQYRDIVNRWDINNIREAYKGKYPFVNMADIILKMSTGTTPPTHNKEYFNGDIDFYTPADINGSMYLEDAERHISQSAIKDNKARLFHKGDLLFVGIGSTVGKVGLVEKETVSSNQQITGITFNTQKVLPEYGFAYMHYFKEYTTADQSKTTLPIVNQEKIAQIPIPLPPIAIQNEIVEHISALRAKQKHLQQQASDLRTQAQQQFEQTIFN